MRGDFMVEAGCTQCLDAGVEGSGVGTKMLL